MKKILLFSLVLLLAACHQNIEELELTGNPYDKNTPINVIEVLDTKASSFGSDCIVILDFTFIPSVHRQLINITNSHDLMSLYFREKITANGTTTYSQINILDENNTFISFSKVAVYSPGISKFEEVEIGQKLRMQVTSTNSNKAEIEAVIVYRDRPKANQFHREDIVKQTIVVPCS